MNQKELFIISVSVFLTIIAWIVLDLYKVKTAADINRQSQMAISITTHIDSHILDILKSRQP